MILIEDCFHGPAGGVEYRIRELLGIQQFLFVDLTYLWESRIQWQSPDDIQLILDGMLGSYYAVGSGKEMVLWSFGKPMLKVSNAITYKIGSSGKLELKHVIHCERTG